MLLSRCQPRSLNGVQCCLARSVYSGVCSGDEAVFDGASLLGSVSLCLIATVTIVTLRYMGVAS